MILAIKNTDLCEEFVFSFTGHQQTHKKTQTSATKTQVKPVSVAEALVE